MNLKIGQTVWYYTGSVRVADSCLKETKITKVGRKWFEVECGYGNRFSIETLRVDSQYTTGVRIYLSDKEYYDEAERNKLSSRFQEIFQYNNNLSLEKLRAINQIINETP